MSVERPGRVGKKIADRFELERYIRGFIISGDVGLRKPDPAIFRHLIGRLSVKTGDAVFVDDNPRNLDSATKLGLKAILFDSNGEYFDHSNYETVRDFSELLMRLSQ